MLPRVLGGVVVLVVATAVRADIPACTVQVDDPEVVFPVEQMEHPALCRVASVVNDYTTHRTVPAIQTPIQKPVYDFLLDHPVLTAVLARNLALGGYRIARIGPDTFHGDDGQGAEGVFTLLYRDTMRRVYHVQGSHRGRLFPLLTGEAIVMLHDHARTGAEGQASVETRMTVYSRIENPVLAMLVKVLQPILRRVVSDKLTNAFLVVHRLGEVIAGDPELVTRLVEATPELDPAEVAALKGMLSHRAPAR